MTEENIPEKFQKVKEIFDERYCHKPNERVALFLDSLDESIYTRSVRIL